MEWNYCSRIESASRQWYVIDLPNQCAWYHVKMSKHFCLWQARLTFTKFLLEDFRCTLSAPGNPSPLTRYVQSLCRFWECCSTDLLKKNQLLEASPWNSHFSYDYITPQVYLLYAGKTDLSRVRRIIALQNIPIRFSPVAQKFGSIENFAPQKPKVPVCLWLKLSTTVCWGASLRAVIRGVTRGQGGRNYLGAESLRGA